MRRATNDVNGGIEQELFDFGRKDRNQALDAEEEALARRVKEAEEASQRKIDHTKQANLSPTRLSRGGPIDQAGKIKPRSVPITI